MQILSIYQNFLAIDVLQSGVSIVLALYQHGGGVVSREFDTRYPSMKTENYIERYCITPSLEPASDGRSFLHVDKHILSEASVLSVHEKLAERFLRAAEIGLFVI